MKKKIIYHWLAILFLLAATLSCGLISGAESIPEPTPEALPLEKPTIQNERVSAGIGQIVFAEDVTENGDLINPTGTFSSNTSTVYAYFEYWGMSDGKVWGYKLTWDGYEYIEAPGEVWEDGSEGWTAYYFNDLEPGHYELSLYIGSEVIQVGSFTISTAQVLDDTPQGAAAFGAIQFATGVTDDWVPIRPSQSFQYGITDVYAVFPHFNLSQGTAWRREWLFEGEVDAARELVWEDEPAGVSYAYFGYEDGETPLDPGNYTLNLYIDGQLARSADFAIIGDEVIISEETRGPAAPAEIIDPNLIQAWEILAYANPEILRDVAQFALDHHIQIILTDEISAKGTYRCSTENRDPGTLYISVDFWKEASWEEVAATMAHELTHAVQHIESGNCGCTIENEYYAYVTEFYVLQETGRMDLLETKWRGAYDEEGRFDSAKLWKAVKEAYPECPDY